MKKLKSFKLDDLCNSRLEELSTRLGISQTEVVTWFIDFGFDILSSKSTDLKPDDLKQRLDYDFDRFVVRFTEQLRLNVD